MIGHFAARIEAELEHLDATVRNVKPDVDAIPFVVRWVTAELYARQPELARLFWAGFIECGATRSPARRKRATVLHASRQIDRQSSRARVSVWIAVEEAPHGGWPLSRRQRRGVDSVSSRVGRRAISLAPWPPPNGGEKGSRSALRLGVPNANRFRKRLT